VWREVVGQVAPGDADPVEVEDGVEDLAQVAGRGAALDAEVTRQSMNLLLQALEREGYVTRPAEAAVRKVLPTRLTPRGQRSLGEATVTVRSVEVRMLAGMTETEQSDAFRILHGMIHSLRDRNNGS
jgi:DNA-binding MarR family transcriptional regulator